MKNRFSATAAVVALLLFGATALSAQRWSLGWQVGAVVSDIKWTNQPIIEGSIAVNPYEASFGFAANGYAAYRFSKRFSLSAQPGFILKGAQFPGNAGPNANIRLRYEYLTLPLLGHFHFRERWQAGLGLEGGYLLDLKAGLAGETRSIKYLFDKDYDLAALADLNYRVWKGLAVGGRFGHSLISIADLTDQDGHPAGEQRHQYGSVYLRYAWQVD